MQLLPGPTYLDRQRCQFRVWALRAATVELHLLTPEDRFLPMGREERGYFQTVVEGVPPGATYFYRLDAERERPDPASRFQPRGVHGPSQVVDPSFPWEDGAWSGIPLSHYIFYELHVGTFTQEGTFDSVIPQLDRLRDLGVTALELMPVAQFPGDRNWGYDGVQLYAAQNSYGGPAGLKRLVNACHSKGLAVVLDVVYNHLGPEGNYLAEYGYYFTDRYRTPWGPAINFDGPHSDEVRRFFIGNALHWVTEFHIDALRLDAVHAIYDASAHPFLEDLAEAVHQRAETLNRRIFAIPESSLNDTRLIRPSETGGFGLDAQWNDDFHHALRTVLTGDRAGYYEDFGEFHQLERAFREGYVYSGQHSVFRQRRHGNSSLEIPPHRFVVFSQNHDQVGNRMLGERLSGLVSFDALKLAAASVVLSPFLPLLFMGEEYGETAPFLYFVSHSDPVLIEAVRKGRKEEFAAFAWQGEPPDPQDEATFRMSKLNPQLASNRDRRILREFYRELIQLRKTQPSLVLLSKRHMEVSAVHRSKILAIRRWTDIDETLLLLHFGSAPTQASELIPIGQWIKVLDSSDERWLGKGSMVPTEVNSASEANLPMAPEACILFKRQERL